MDNLKDADWINNKKRKTKSIRVLQYFQEAYNLSEIDLEKVRKKKKIQKKQQRWRL